MVDVRWVQETIFADVRHRTERFPECNNRFLYNIAANGADIDPAAEVSDTTAAGGRSRSRFPITPRTTKIWRAFYENHTPVSPIPPRFVYGCTLWGL